MELFLVGMGGALGSIVRYKLGKIISQRTKTSFPVGTFLINITGAVLLGLLNALNPGRNPTLLIGDGFLGAYTTFSTYMYEGVQLFEKNKRFNAGIYIIASLFIGIISYIIGLMVGNILQ